MTNIEFHPEAQAELEDARSWYRERSQVAARAFATEVARAIRSIAQSPEAWPQTRSNERRFVSSDFRTQLFIVFARTTCSLRRLLTKGDVRITGVDEIEIKHKHLMIYF